MWFVFCAIKLIYLLTATNALSFTPNGLALRRETRNRKNCILPEYPAFGSWSLFFNSAEFKPGMLIIDGSIIQLSCQRGYTLNGATSLTCENGKWTPQMGQCLASTTSKINSTIPLAIPSVSTTKNFTRNGCILPDYQFYGRWKVAGKYENIEPGMRVEQGTILTTTCDSGYKLVGESAVYCTINNTWSNSIPKCLGSCPSFQKTKATKVICSYQNRELENCDTPVDGTVARFECSPFHENLNFRNPVSVCVAGSWTSPKSECTPICGQKFVESHPLIIGGRVARKGSYPWHVAVYFNKNNEYICGGTLISQRLVLTAATCVTNLKGKLMPKENYIVAAGKVHRKYDDPADSVSAQFSTLDSIHIPSRYEGEDLNFMGDIAVLVTTTSFKISKMVQPVCIDWSGSYNLPTPKSVGYVAGWGYTHPKRNASDQLKELIVPIVDSATCAKNVPKDFKIFLTPDKICAGYVNRSNSICQGDSGGGLFVEYQNRNYIVGIASLGPHAPDGGCSSQHYAAYTNVKHYTNDLISTSEIDVRVDNIKINNQAETDCPLPVHPKNGEWALVGSKFLAVPEDLVSSGSVIEVACNASYTLRGSKFLKCTNGKWNSTIGTCAAPCPPITGSRSIQVSCSSGNNPISCFNATHGSLATFTCSPFYENLDLSGNPFRTCQDGQWKPDVPNCVPTCGLKLESEEGKNYNPWNVAIYQIDGGNRNFKCAGTLINERIVLTGAQCISDDVGTKFSPNNYIVAAGRSTLNDNGVQYSELEDIAIDKEYGGKLIQYWADIALLVTKKPFNMSKDVQLACIDWQQKFSENLDFSKFKGSVPASLTSQIRNQTDLELSFFDINQCYGRLLVNSSYLTFDKICSGIIKDVNRASKCKMDQGVGLVSKSAYDNRYYLVGIASDFFPSNSEDCDTENYIVLFTQVSKHISNFIAEKNKLYTPVNTPYFQSFCGVRSVQAQTLIVGGNNVSKSEYPWQVAIYKTKPNGKKLFICGGALINQRIILTAAHCVTEKRGVKLPLDHFHVAVGKYYRRFDHQDDHEAQFSTLIDIIVPPTFEGEYQNYVGDIALLISEKSFILSKHVQPVCVDWEGKYETYLLKNSVVGYVSGWGFTKQNRDPSDVLKDLRVQYVDRDSCRKHLPPDFDIFLTFDKICSGVVNRSEAVCRGDSGGGLVFRNEIDGRYYIFGIVGLAPQAPSEGCNVQTYSLYTKISYYLKDFILRKAQLYWR